MYPRKRSIRDLELSGRTLFLRVDYNVPIQAGRVVDDTRVRASIPSIRVALEKGARVVLASHLGRPKGRRDPALSLEPVSGCLSSLLGNPVRFVGDCLGPPVRRAVDSLGPGEILLLENLRFHSAEVENDLDFAGRLAAVAEEYVNDAFGTAHRSHASTVGVPTVLGRGAAGLLMEKELRHLDRVLSDPRPPVVAILGGAKVSGKIGVIENFLSLADTILMGGGMAFTFLKALGVDVGQSLVEESCLETARKALREAKKSGTRLVLPEDVVVARECVAGEETWTVPVESLPPDRMGLDIGPGTRRRFGQEIEKAETVIWNGPLGVFEVEEFAAGTLEVARSVGASRAFSVVGGGESAAAVVRAGIRDRIDHVSTGGGASLDYLAGKTLPGVAVLSGSD
ncbi:MAG: phosphoglycerate kinase [Candidatus Aminicenantes bacterium]|nr:phosphoglycerate kinase [Candidatus Aminicenantes bacterium]